MHAAVGEELTVTLGSNPTTGLQWSEAAWISDETIIISWLSLPLLPDMIFCLLFPSENGFCIWLSLFVVETAKQFVGKMLYWLLYGSLCEVVRCHDPDKKISLAVNRNTGVCLPVSTLSNS